MSEYLKVSRFVFSSAATVLNKYYENQILYRILTINKMIISYMSDDLAVANIKMKQKVTILKVILCSRRVA